MINVKCLTQNWSKSNNINNVLHLNYFQRKYYGCQASTKTQLILHELGSQITLFQNYEKNSFMLIKNREKWKIILKSKKICESAYLKGNVVSLFKNMIFNDFKP